MQLGCVCTHIRPQRRRLTVKLESQDQVRPVLFQIVNTDNSLVSQVILIDEIYDR